MRVTNILCLLLSGFALPAFAQFDKWEIHQAYQSTTQVTETNNYVFAVADSSLYAYGKEDNSPLESAISGDRYVRIGDVTLDDDKNLWITNCISSEPIKVLTAEGEWISYGNTDIDNAEIIDKILITQQGYKFINLRHSSKPGIYVFDDNGTISD